MIKVQKVRFIHVLGLFCDFFCVPTGNSALTPRGGDDAMVPHKYTAIGRNVDYEPTTDTRNMIKIDHCGMASNRTQRRGVLSPITPI